MKYLNLCLGNREKGSKTLKVNMYIFMMILSISVIMFLCVKYYVGRHSQNASVKYGRYQRNIVTLTQTVQFLLSYISVEVLLSLVLSVLEANKFSR